MARLIKKAAPSLRWRRWRHHVDIIQIIKKQAAIKKRAGVVCGFYFVADEFFYFDTGFVAGTTCICTDSASARREKLTDRCGAVFYSRRLLIPHYTTVL
jgi:hypothetical protein